MVTGVPVRFRKQESNPALELTHRNNYSLVLCVIRIILPLRSNRTARCAPLPPASVPREYCHCSSFDSFPSELSAVSGPNSRLASSIVDTPGSRRPACSMSNFVPIVMHPTNNKVAMLIRDNLNTGASKVRSHQNGPGPELIGTGMATAVFRPPFRGSIR